MLTKADLLKGTNTSSRQLKVFRDLGLIPAPRRQANRNGPGTVTLYTEEAIKRIHEIRALREKGFTLLEARDRILAEQRSCAWRELVDRLLIEFRRRHGRLMTEKELAGFQQHLQAASMFSTPEDIWTLAQRDRDFFTRSTGATVQERAAAIEAAFRGARPARLAAAAPPRPRPRTRSAPRTARQAKTGHRPREDTAGEEGDAPKLSLSSTGKTPTSA